MEEIYTVTDTGLIDPKTGELIEPKDYIRDNFECAKELLLDANKVAKNFGIKFNVKIVKKKEKTYLYSNVKEGFDFQKIMQISVQGLFQHKMNVYSKAFIGQFTPFLSFPENCVKINGSPPSIEEFAKLMEVKRNKIYEVLQELQYLEVINKVKSGRGILVYFNPFLYSVGLVDLETVKMFAGSIYNIKDS